MKKRVRDKDIKFRKIFAASRAVVASIVLVVYGLLTLIAGLEDMIANLISKRMVVLFFVQDILLILYGVFLFQFGCVYGIFGLCQQNYFIRNLLRLGRRTMLHLSMLLFTPAIIYILVGIVGEILYTGAISAYFHDSDDKITAATIWIGSGQTTYKVVYSVLMWVVSVISILMYWISVFNSSTFRFLWTNRSKNKESLKTIQYIRELKKQKPDLSLICSTYNVDIKGRGSYTVQEEEKVIDTVEKPFQYTKCFDASGDFKIGATVRSDQSHFTKLFRKIFPLVYIRLRLSWCYVWDREENQEVLEEACRNLLAETTMQFKGKHQYARVELKASLRNFEDENTVLIRVSDDVEGKKDPFWTNVYVYFIFSALGLSLIFRQFFDLVCTEEKEFKIIKRLSTDQRINRKKVYDQNTEGDTIKKTVISISEKPTSLTPVLDEERMKEIQDLFSRETDFEAGGRRRGNEGEEEEDVTVNLLTPVTPYPFNSKRKERLEEVLDTRRPKIKAAVDEKTHLLKE